MTSVASRRSRSASMPRTSSSVVRSPRPGRRERRGSSPRPLRRDELDHPSRSSRRSGGSASPRGRRAGARDSFRRRPRHRERDVAAHRRTDHDELALGSLQHPLRPAVDRVAAEVVEVRRGHVVVLQRRQLRLPHALVEREGVEEDDVHGCSTVTAPSASRPRRARAGAVDPERLGQLGELLLRGGSSAGESAVRGRGSDRGRLGAGQPGEQRRVRAQRHRVTRRQRAVVLGDGEVLVDHLAALEGDEPHDLAPLDAEREHDPAGDVRELRRELAQPIGLGGGVLVVDADPAVRGAETTLAADRTTRGTKRATAFSTALWSSVCTCTDPEWTAWPASRCSSESRSVSSDRR